MRYLGGKKQIAKAVASQINRVRQPGQWVWEPFCGGLGVSVALSKAGPVWATDACAPLIAMFRAAAAGWQPPTELSKEAWQAAKALPDSDPLKAFAGFACSFRGLWFSGYAGGYVGPVSRFGAIAASEVIVKDAKAPAQIDCLNFLDVEPCETQALIYCDPPYAGTTAYKAVRPFDSQRFLLRVAAWARFTDVFVSEYQFPIGTCVWEHSRARKLAVGRNSSRATERLYYLPKGSKF